MLTRAFYESRITGRFGPLILLTLQRKCLQRNREAGITSYLFHDHERVFQVVEGEEDAVQDCLRRIGRSDLHDNIRIRAIMRCPERAFERWHFGATNIDDKDYRRVAVAGHMPDFFALDVLRAERLLSIVASRKRRAVKADAMAVALHNFAAGQAPKLLHSVRASAG